MGRCLRTDFCLLVLLNLAATISCEEVSGLMSTVDAKACSDLVLRVMSNLLVSEYNRAQVDNRQLLASTGDVDVDCDDAAAGATGKLCQISVSLAPTNCLRTAAVDISYCGVIANQKASACYGLVDSTTGRIALPLRCDGDELNDEAIANLVRLLSAAGSEADKRAVRGWGVHGGSIHPLRRREAWTVYDGSYHHPAGRSPQSGEKDVKTLNGGWTVHGGNIHHPLGRSPQLHESGMDDESDQFPTGRSPWGNDDGSEHLFGGRSPNQRRWGSQSGNKHII